MERQPKRKPEEIIRQQIKQLNATTSDAQEWMRYAWQVIILLVTKLLTGARAGVARLLAAIRDNVTRAIGGLWAIAWGIIDYITPRFALSVFVIPMLMLIPVLVYTNQSFALTWIDGQSIAGLELHWYYYYMLLGICAVVLINTDHPHALAGVVAVIQLYAVILVAGIASGGFAFVAVTSIIYLIFGSLCALIAIKFSYRLKRLETRIKWLTAMAMQEAEGGLGDDRANS